MTTEANQAVVQHFYEAINSRHLAMLDELIAPTFTGLKAAGEDVVLTGEGFKRLLAFLLADFSACQLSIHEWQAEQETVVTCWSLDGRQRREYLGLPCVEKQLQATGRDMFRVVGGQIVEYWVELHTLYLGRRLVDVVPGDEEE